MPNNGSPKRIWLVSPTYPPIPAPRPTSQGDGVCARAQKGMVSQKLRIMFLIFKRSIEMGPQNTYKWEFIRRISFISDNTDKLRAQALNRPIRDMHWQKRCHRSKRECVVPLFPTSYVGFCTGFHFFPQFSCFGTCFYFCVPILGWLLLLLKFLPQDLPYIVQVFQFFKKNFEKIKIYEFN